MTDTDTYHVVVNEEEQYSIWRAGDPVPAGWATVGEPATKDACLDEIERLWTDMRPASVRRWMEENGF